MRQRSMRFATVSLTIRSEFSEDRGVGIIVLMSPMTVLVPLHLITTLQEDPTAKLTVNGDMYDQATLLDSPDLERDELALIRLRGRRPGPIGSVRIPRREVRLRPGQRIALGATASPDRPVRMGTIVEVRERAGGTTVVTDVEVEAGDSGSAVIVNRQLVAVCQGMLPNGEGGVAIAMPLSTRALESLWKLRRQSFLYRGLPVLVAALLALGLGVVGVLAPTWLGRDVGERPGDGGHVILREPVTVRDDGLIVRHMELERGMFFADLGDDVKEDPQGEYARVMGQGSIEERVHGMIWTSRSPVDLTVSMTDGPLDGVVGARVTLSASTEMDVDLSLDADGTACGRIVQNAGRVERTVRVGEEPRTFDLEAADGAISGCVEGLRVGDWSIELRPDAPSGRLWVHRIELIHRGAEKRSSYWLPMWPRLFDPAINTRNANARVGAVRIEGDGSRAESIVTMIWDTDPRNPVDVSYDLDERLGPGAEAMALTLSSSKAMDVRVHGAWEGGTGDLEHHTLGSTWILRVDPEPRRFVLPYSSFTMDVYDRCPGPHEDPNWERLVCLTFWPEAGSGELRFHEFRLLVADPPAGEADRVYQPIDGFSAGTVPINWWYIPTMQDGEMTFVDARPRVTSSEDGIVRFRYPDQSSLRTLVLQLHDTHRPVDFRRFDGVEITARTDDTIECEIEIGFLDHGIPEAPGDPEEWPGENYAYPKQSILLTTEPTTHRIPFDDLHLDPSLLARHPDASRIFMPEGLIEVKFLPLDEEGVLDVMGVRLYGLEPSE